MIAALLSLPLWAGLVAAVLAMTSAACLAFAVVRLAAFRMESPSSVIDTGNWGAVRIGAIHALILGLVFAEVRQERSELTETIDAEALAVEQLHRELDRIEGPAASAIQAKISAYVDLVIDEEWASLERGIPLEAADRLVDEIRSDIAELAQTPAGSIAGPALLDDVNDLENHRGQRSFDIVEPVSGIFWITALSGFALTSFCFFVHPPTPSRFLVLALFSAMNGLVFFAILSLTHPFYGDSAVTPYAFETVRARTLSVSR